MLVILRLFGFAILIEWFGALSFVFDLYVVFSFWL